MVLSVDDAHWADPSSMQFLGYLARRIEGLPVLLSPRRVPRTRRRGALARAHERPRRRDPATGPAVPRRLLLRCCEAALGRGRRAFSAAHHEATGGDPFFLVSLVAALDAAQVDPTADAAGAAVETVGPPAVGRFVLRRLELLGAPATELARTVAVLGATSDLPLAARAADSIRRRPRDVADLLVRADMLAADRELASCIRSSRPPSTRICFRGARRAPRGCRETARGVRGAGRARRDPSHADHARRRSRNGRDPACRRRERGSARRARGRDRISAASAARPPPTPRTTVLADLGRLEPLASITRRPRRTCWLRSRAQPTQPSTRARRSG